VGGFSRIFCDDMGVVHQAVNGYAKELDAKLLSHCFHVHAARLQIRSWIEYVNTLSNCSDGGSREGVSCKLAQRLGIPLRYIACPIVHDFFPRPSLQLEAVRLA
jgi:hypothetical protein